MRDYAKIAPPFWIGQTGKRIRSHGTAAQVVALYLVSSPHSNMIGLYHAPIAYISADTGIPIEGASKALASLIQAGFCDYDYESEVVFVFEMAKHQIGGQLKPNDKQCIGVQKAYDSVPENRFLSAFYEKYSLAFNLTTSRTTASPIEAPSKGLGSQEQEQEQEQKQDKPTCAPAKAERESGNNLPSLFVKFWEVYPRKRSKGDALKAWRKIKPSKELAEQILQAIERAKSSAEWIKDGGQFIPYPATWLNARGWEDETYLPADTTTASGRWWDTWPGIERRAKELSVVKKDGEHDHAFKVRVFEAAKKSGEKIVRAA